MPEKSAKVAAKPPTKKKIPKPEEIEMPIPVFRYCSFCRKPSETRKRLVAGPNNIFICDECIEVCVAILLEDDKDDWKLRLKNLLLGRNKFKTEMDNAKPHHKKVKKPNA